MEWKFNVGLYQICNFIEFILFKIKIRAWCRLSLISMTSHKSKLLCVCQQILYETFTCVPKSINKIPTRISEIKVEDIKTGLHWIGSHMTRMSVTFPCRILFTYLYPMQEKAYLHLTSRVKRTKFQELWRSSTECLVKSTAWTFV
jgi:hypothetical protein